MALFAVKFVRDLGIRLSVAALNYKNRIHFLAVERALGGGCSSEQFD
jgi:hypothetical protein